MEIQSGEENKDSINQEENKENKEIQENQESEIQFSKVIQKEEDTNQNIESNQKNEIFSTKVFMKSIDLRCEDHLTKFQEDIEATRFCQKCNVLVCDSCVIDYHLEHINLAKKKVDEYFISQKNNIVELKNKVQDSVKYKINEKEIDKIINSQKKLIEDFFSRRAEEYDLFIKKLDNLQKLEKELKDAMIKSVEIFYKDESYKRLQNPIEKNEFLGKKIESFIKEWTQFNKREKVMALKHNIIEDFQKEVENNLNLIQEEMKNFKGKSLDIEKKINGLIDTIQKDDKINELNKIYNEMNERCLNILKDINDLKYDNLTVQKIENIKNKKAEVDYDYKALLKDKLFNQNNDNNNIKQNIDNNQNNFNNAIPQQVQQNPSKFQEFHQPINNNQQIPNKNIIQNNLDNNLDGNSKSGEFNLFNNGDLKDIKFSNSNILPNNNSQNFNNQPNMKINQNYNNNNQNNYNNVQNNNDDDISNPYEIKQNNPNMNNNYPQVSQVPQVQPNQQNQQLMQQGEPQFNYELIIYLIADKIIAYNEKNGLFSLNLNSDILRRVPEKSRFVNLGQSALLTGGMTPENKSSQRCYLIGLIEDYSTNRLNYNVNISPYGDFKEGRERHNLIYLPNKNYVLACGGFFSKSCEYSDIYRGNWELIAPMNKSRGNASMVYVNDRFIYIIGGFELRNDAPKGNYLNDLEIFDVNNFGNGWRLVNFANPHKYNLNLTALGVVPISKTIFLICGGYDGREYKKNVYKVDCNNYLYPLVEETTPLNDTTIFTHNLFCKIKKSYFNFDFQGQMYGFDYDNWQFGKLNMNQMYNYQNK